MKGRWERGWGGIEGTNKALQLKVTKGRFKRKSE